MVYALSDKTFFSGALMVGVCEKEAMGHRKTRTKGNIKDGIFTFLLFLQFVENIHDALKFLLVGKWNADLSLAFR